MFLARDVIAPGGEVVRVVKSTASLTTEEFNEYVHRCIRWLSSHGVPVPELGEE
jgi:hypothetical protein